MSGGDPTIANIIGSSYKVKLGHANLWRSNFVCTHSRLFLSSSSLHTSTRNYCRVIFETLATYLFNTKIIATFPGKKKNF